MNGLPPVEGVKEFLLGLSATLPVALWGYKVALKQVREGRHPGYDYYKADIDELSTNVAYMDKEVDQISQRIAALSWRRPRAIPMRSATCRSTRRSSI